MLRLTAREVLDLGGKHQGQRLKVRSGRAWITQSNDPADYVLGAGDSLTITRPGKVLVQSLCADTELSLAG